MAKVWQHLWHSTDALYDVSIAWILRLYLQMAYGRDILPKNCTIMRSRMISISIQPEVEWCKAVVRLCQLLWHSLISSYKNVLSPCKGNSHYGRRLLQAWGMAGCRWSQAQPCGSRRNQVLRSCGERRNSCSTGEQDKEGQITLLVIKERPSGRFFLHLLFFAEWVLLL